MTLCKRPAPSALQPSSVWVKRSMLVCHGSTASQQQCWSLRCATVSKGAFSVPHKKLHAKVAKIYNKNTSSIHKIVRKEKWVFRYHTKDTGGAWWHMSVILSLGKQRQEDLKFEASDTLSQKIKVLAQVHGKVLCG